MEMIENVKTYVVAPKSEADYLKYCSSAGVFYWAARFVLEKNGVIFGATLKNNEVFHKGIINEKELYSLLGSKYVRSNLKNTFQECFEILSQDKYVLYCGCPCQINALYFFLKQKRCQHLNKLISMDIICHGAPEPKYFSQYLKEKRIKLNDYYSINMRDKSAGWGSTAHVKENSKIIESSKHPYMRLFLDNYLLCKSCFNCKHKGENRSASFTIGDAWGYEHYSTVKNPKYGLSIIFLRDGYNQDLFNYISEKMILTPVNYNDAIMNNKSYFKSATMKNDYQQIVNRINKKGLIKTYKFKYYVGIQGAIRKTKALIKAFISKITRIHLKYKRKARADKKRVGIVTVYAFSQYNYGNRLQNFALSKKIKELGFKPVNVYFANLNFLKYPIRRFYKRIKFRLKDKRYNKIRHIDIKSHIKETWIVNETSTINKIFKFKKILYGGDQVWGCDSKSFALRLGNYCVNTTEIEKCSYSASLGIYSDDDNVKETFSRSLSNFSHVSVREKEAANYLAKLGIKVSLVCDPVFLYNAKDWQFFIKKYSSISIPKQKYVFCYCLDHKNRQKLDTDINVIDVLEAESKYSKINYFDFIKLLLNSEYVFTDSYHAILFSIIFNKKFVLYLREGTSAGLTRFKSIFDILDIQYQYNSGALFSGQINKENLESFIKESSDYLSKIIKG